MKQKKAAPRHITGLTDKDLITDTPLSCFLYGGIDSYPITALAAKTSTVPISRYTILFTNPQYNEADQVQKTHEQLGIKHKKGLGSTDEAANLVLSSAKSGTSHSPAHPKP